MLPIGSRAARWMTARYSLALSVIALCALAGFAMNERVVAEHEDMLEVVNISGRQRMLSQRAAFLVEKLRQPATPEQGRDLIRRLTEVTDAFAAQHRRLTGLGLGQAESSGSPQSAGSLSALYFAGPESLNDAVLAYIAALRAVIAAAPAGLAPDMPELRHVESEAIGPLLARLEDMVARYQETGEEAFETLHSLGLAALLLTLAALLVEAMVIFRPMVRHVQSQLASILHMAEALEQANDRLEAQVRERTDELRLAKEAAERANRAKSRFLAHAGHDLRQPLEAIGMFTGMLERQVETPRARALLRDQRAALRSMRDLLTAILEISRLESGVVEPRLADVPLAPLFAQLTAEFGPLAEAKGLTLRCVRPYAVVRTDASLLERILRNFLSNAIRYTESGRVLIGCRRDGGSLRIEVHDTGPGIPEAERRHIFDEFVQLDQRDRDRSEGIGLGLAIVDRLARLLRLPVTVRSAEGRGSVFAVGVPLVASAANLVTAPPPSPEAPPASGSPRSAP